MEPLPAHVDGPPAQPQRGGLVDASFPGQNVDETGRDINWTLGVQCWFENGAGWTLVHDGAALTSTDPEVDYGNADVNPAPTAGRPVMLRTSVIGPRPSRGEDMRALMRGRVLRRLEAVTSQAMARELWTGRLSQSQPYELAANYGWTNPTADSGTSWSNPFLAAAGLDGLAAGPLPAMRALGLVEEALGDRVAGGPLTIHLPLSVLSEVAFSLSRVPVPKRPDLTGDYPGGAPSGGYVQGADPFVLTTAKGSLVVADTGSPGWGPGVDEDSNDTDRGVPWIYGSGPVMSWVGEPTPYDQLHEVVNPATNRAEMWADRPLLTLFDPLTVVGAAVAPPT